MKTLLYNKAKICCGKTEENPMLPWRWKRGLDLKQEQRATITIGLIAVNVSVFFIMLILGKTEDTLFILEHGAMYEPYILNGHEYYRLLTSMFLHFGIGHLMNNMLMLGALGWNLELETGKLRFLLIYFISGLGGNVFSLFMNWYYGRSVVSAGASGAVFGLMGALVCAAIRNRGYVGRLNRRGLILMAALSLYVGLTESGVDNAAHIGGLVCGFLTQAILGALW